MTTITIPAKYIQAALTCVAVRDVRYYFNGIHFERELIVSTDGHRMLVIHMPGLDIDPCEVHADAFKNVKKDKDVTITIKDGMATVECAGVSAKVKMDEARYPDWRRVIPRECSAHVGHVEGIELRHLARHGQSGKDTGLDPQGCAYDPHRAQRGGRRARGL